MKITLQNATFVALALLMVIFGLNKFFGFIPVEPPKDPVAQSFLGAMFTTYLFKVVAVAEILGGILLVFPRTRILGWLLLAPVIFNIIMFHFAHDFIGNGIWILPSILFMVLGYWLKEDLIKIVKL